MRANEHGDDEGTAITERPGAPTDCWRCDGDDYEPVRYATMLEATSDKPLSPGAWVSSRGELMAVSAEDVAQWSFSPAGMKRLEADMSAAVERDYDAVIRIVLSEDLRAMAEAS